MTVELLKDLLASGEGDKDLPQGKFFFAHSETFLPLLVALGIAKDEVGICEISFHLLTLLQPPLSVENMPADRKWRTSLIGGRQKQKCSWTSHLVLFRRVLKSRNGGAQVQGQPSATAAILSQREASGTSWLPQGLVQLSALPEPSRNQGEC